MELISVIVTTYNRPAMLRRCLVALGEQQIRNLDLQIVVVDDCSRPENVIETRAICGSFNKLTYSLNANNVGLSASRNQGARLARGSMLLFLDDDIIVSPTYVQSHADILLKSTDVATVGNLSFPPELIKIDNLARYLNSRELGQRVDERELPRKLKPGQFGGGICGVRRSHFDKFGGFSEQFVFYGAEDLALGTVLTESGISIVFGEEARALHLDNVTLERYKVKTMENARYGMKILMKHYPNVFKETYTKYLLPVLPSDTVGQFLLKKALQIFCSNFMEKICYTFAARTNSHSFFYSKFVFSVLFASWTIEGLKEGDDSGTRISKVTYGQE